MAYNFGNDPFFNSRRSNDPFNDPFFKQTNPTLNRSPANNKNFPSSPSNFPSNPTPESNFPNHHFPHLISRTFPPSDMTKGKKLQAKPNQGSELTFSEYCNQRDAFSSSNFSSKDNNFPNSQTYTSTKVDQALQMRQIDGVKELNQKLFKFLAEYNSIPDDEKSIKYSDFIELEMSLLSYSKNAIFDIPELQKQFQNEVDKFKANSPKPPKYKPLTREQEQETWRILNQ